MKIRVVAGVGRSGTTWLARMLALSTSPMKVVMEPFARAARVPDNGQVEPFSVLPGSRGVHWARAVLLSLKHSNAAIEERSRDWTVERDDAGAEFLLVKVTHSLLALPEILKGLEYRAVVITRSTDRVIDSFFHGHRLDLRHYLVDEYRHLGLPHIRDEVLQQTIVTEIVKRYLVALALGDKRVTRVTFEDLCCDPAGECKRLYAFLGLGRDDVTLGGIAEMTTGTETGYYDTRKDSRAVLRQGFKYLASDQVEAVRRCYED